MRRFRLMLVAAALGAIALNIAPHSVGPADAANCIKIQKIYYDSPGPDSGSNESLNGEWIRLKNICGSAKNLWYFEVRDAAGNSYYFGSPFSLNAGSRVKIHTGSGTNTSTDRYWSRAKHVWGNTKDTARLYNASSALIRTCSYDDASVNATTC
jgi:hypothetical protein